MTRKIHEMIEDHQVYPTQFVITYRDIRSDVTKVARHPFPEVDAFEANPRCFIATILE